MRLEATPARDPRGEAGAPPLGERFAATPRLACEALARALNLGDLEAATACFAPGACLIGPDGAEKHGEAPIRALLAELIAAHTQVAIELSGVLVAGGVALAHERWTIGSEGRGSHAAQAYYPTLVLRQIGADWKLAIAAPWGWDPAPPLEAI